MKITTDQNEYHDFIIIAPFENSPAHISINRHKKAPWDDPDLKIPKINWSACGRVNIDDAKLFAAGLNEAIKIAEELENEPKNS